jgi:mannosylglycerate hydrolase
MIKLTDKRTGLVYQEVNFFEDSGDVGDEYTYSYPETDECFTSNQFPARVRVLENGPLRASLKIEHRMVVPKAVSRDEKSRSLEKAELPISTVLSLNPTSCRVDVKTTVQNAIKDHRLRALFATDIQSTTSFAETPFAVVKREHQAYDVSQFPFEHPAKVAPMQRFVTISDAKKGLTLIVKGLPEYELKLDEPGTIALTLLRCVGKLSGRNLITRPGGAAGWWSETPEAQCQGMHTFEYSLYPHASVEMETWSSILKEVEFFTAPPLVVKRKNEQTILGASFLSVRPDHLLLSALKEAEDRNGVIVRVSNPVGSEIEGRISFQRLVKEAYLAKLNEENIKPLTIIDGREVSVNMKPYEIKTIRICF